MILQIIAAAGYLAMMGITENLTTVMHIPFTDVHFDLGFFAYPLYLLVLVGFVNSTNITDGLDGLASSVGVSVSMALIVMSVILGSRESGVAAGLLLGALLGFLVYNHFPAKIFMGDTGATFLGFILATMSIQGLFKYYAVISFVVPFLILGLPIFDVCFAVIRRVSKGQSPMTPDRSHVHHKLIDMGMSQKQAVGTLYVITAILSLSAGT